MQYVPGLTARGGFASTEGAGAVHTRHGVEDPQFQKLLGRAVQVEPMKPLLKPPGTKRLKLKYDGLLSNLLQICFYSELVPLQVGGLNLSVVPRVMEVVGGLAPRTPLPMYWSVDFIPASSGSACQILLAES